MPARKRYTAFVGTRVLASGSRREVAEAAKQHAARNAAGSPLVFNDATGQQIEIDDLHGGRPRMGVVAREVTLLPRHWDWLGGQPGGASAALRRLVDEAQHAKPAAARLRQARDATFRFLTAVAGDLPGCEEVLSALFAGDGRRFVALVGEWPVGVSFYAMSLSQDAFEGEPRS